MGRTRVYDDSINNTIYLVWTERNVETYVNSYSFVEAEECAEDFMLLATGISNPAEDEWTANVSDTSAALEYCDLIADSNAVERNCVEGLTKSNDYRCLMSDCANAFYDEVIRNY